MLRSITTQKWHVFLVLAIGVGTFWGVAVVLLGSIGSALFPQVPVNYESVIFSINGNPLIETRIGGSYQNIEIRTLDGEVIELHQANRLNPCSFPQPYQEPGVLEMPITWRERIAGANDQQKKPVSWIVVRDAARPGHAYFAGYDLITKYCVGYIGRKGFRSSIPPNEEWFALGNHLLTYGNGRFASMGYMQYGTPYSYYSGIPRGKEQLMPWLIFFAEKDDILEIDLLERKVRKLTTIAGMQSLNIVTTPLAAKRNASKQPENSGDIERATSWIPTTINEVLFGQLTDDLFVSKQYNHDPKRELVNRLIARCSDKLVVFNPFDGSQQEFKLPKHMQHGAMTAYFPSPDQMILQVSRGKWEQGDVVDIAWIDPEGNIAREDNLRLTGYTPEDPKKTTWLVAAVVPSLLPWLLGALVVAPITLVQSNQAENYVAALQETFVICWPALLTVVILSLILVSVVNRWQKNYYRGHTPLWCSVVLLGTVPGFFAYWLMHRDTVLEDCADCGQAAPRDRECCAYCSKPYSKPENTGIEIFA